MRTGVLLLLAVSACVQNPPSPLEGAGQSNRDLTLAEFRAAREFTAEQWQLLSDPTFFGHMIHIYRGNAGITVFDGECSPASSFEIVHARWSSPTIRYRDEFSEEERTITVGVEGDRLYVPISVLEGQLRETFTRVSLEDVMGRHPCTHLFLEGGREAA